MKRRIVAALMAATMCLAMSVTTFAADSPETQKPSAPVEEQKPVQTINPENVKVTVVDAEGNVKEVEAPTITEIKEEVQKVIEDKETFVQNVIKDNLESNPEVAKELQDADEVIVLAGMDIEVELAEGEVAKVNVGQIEGVNAGDEVRALHRKKDGTWEVLKATVDAEGNVTVEMTSFSPVVFVKLAKAPVEPQAPAEEDKKPEAPSKEPAGTDDKNAAKDENKTTSTNKTTGTTTTAKTVAKPGTSPKTGDR